MSHDSRSYLQIYISRGKKYGEIMLYISNLPEFVRKYHCSVADKNTVALRGPSRSLKRSGLGWAWRAHPSVSLDLCRRSNPRSRHHSLKQRESKFLYRVHFPRLLSYTFNKIFFFQISNSVMKHLTINWWNLFKSLNLRKFLKSRNFQNNFKDEEK